MFFNERIKRFIENSLETLGGALDSQNYRLTSGRHLAEVLHDLFTGIPLSFYL
jgi:hypothetical protein